MTSNGLVYILTNPCLDGWIKIGMTEKPEITDRLKELNQPSNIPLSYQCYATYEVENPLTVEQCVHRLIDKIDFNLHAIETLDNGKVRKREFFRIAPETAFSILEEVANLRGDSDKLNLFTVDEYQPKKGLDYRNVLKTNTTENDSVIDSIINDTYHNKNIQTQPDNIVFDDINDEPDVIVSARRRRAGNRIDRRKTLNRKTS